MNLDIRTLIFVLGVTHIIQIGVFFYQYLVNRNCPGTGWWLMWSTAEVIGFAFMLLRQIPSIQLGAIICQNFLIVSGVIFLYIGIMRFLDKKENRWAVGLILAVFVVALVYFTCGNNDIRIRGIIISATLAVVSFLTAYALVFYRPHSIATSANFAATVFIAHGGYFAFRALMILTGTPADNFFAPTLFNVAAFVDALIVSILWTIVLIVMMNQRLNAELTEAKEEMELVFNTSPDAAIITRLSDGLIVYANEGFSVLSGFTRDESIGKSTLEVNIWQNKADRQKVVTELSEKGFCESVEALFQNKGGNQLIGMISAKIITLQGVPHIISVTRDITERKQAEDKIKKLLSEKELLLREVHHRIKNNMNVVMSLLSLQSDTMKDPSAINAMQDAGNRIRSMMLLYDKLYRSSDFREISTRGYLTTLIGEIVNNFPKRGSVTIETYIDDVILDAKTLSPIGMILNELLTNIMKYAFTGRGNGVITISLSVRDTHATLIIKDNGIGIPESIDIATSTGFGMQLVGMLAEQLEGTIRIERENGTRFVLEFEV
jgi:PAS domain S-box-containing protein